MRFSLFFCNARLRLLSLLVAINLLLVGCAQYSDKRGVEVTWDAAVMDTMVKGQTTRAEVLVALGPPSQIIALGDETVLYYLFEKSDGEGLILIVYNQFEVETRYDRAVFFFDSNDQLTEYSSHVAASP
jgi:outer membrane protein assembly factor BamE (lipoprotein component of BamABCDE complex)